MSLPASIPLFHILSEYLIPPSSPPPLPLSPYPALPQKWARTTEEEAGSHQDEPLCFRSVSAPLRGPLESIHVSVGAHAAVCICVCAHAFACVCQRPKPVSVCLCPGPCVLGLSLGDVSDPRETSIVPIKNTQYNTHARSLSVRLSLCPSVSMSLSLFLFLSLSCAAADCSVV